ncbi:hypothetical protein FDA09_00640 [Clostridium botulinum]|uniref:hypothetical protein n=1 Tax=Clostridium botulinum TaxID=1491 RepID=UPI000773E7A6|nr:hypothetical protein [Clostridium botulinum]NFH80183.1 hypothetical protein [Clostridium botulinum]NFH81924.1 hypothetical protein [Clostridium botulinum]NFI09898.1 hypothetical protein [Clostridium botulinum]NFI14957.1 hypothetical protein [Clostridium botulinum]NFO84789.1 hypothetical protein [Clostridium botulinum]
MGRKKEKDFIDLTYQEEEEECCFTDYVPPDKDSITLFSFNNDSGLDSNEEDNNTVDLAANNNSNEYSGFQTKSNTHSDNLSLNNDNNNENINNKMLFSSSNYNTYTLSTNNLFDNRKTPIANGAASPIDGEDANIKRSYTLRSSTVRKINKFKSIHPDINICVSTLVDIAISYYHNHIVNTGGFK